MGQSVWETKVRTCRVHIFGGKNCIIVLIVRLSCLLNCQTVYSVVPILFSPSRRSSPSPILVSLRPPSAPVPTWCSGWVSIFSVLIPTRGRPANSSRTFLQPEVMIKKVSANMRDFRHFEKHNISYLLARMTCRYLPDSEVFLADTYKQSKSI